ncbi:MAG: hypothetical protein HC876_20440 [Chloroflexaceae bacterium]|nr:hypothetical protein [Chloroflexaceae bacterium]
MEEVRRRLAARTHEWVQRGRGQGRLLDEVELREAERWLQSTAALRSVMIQI